MIYLLSPRQDMQTFCIFCTDFAGKAESTINFVGS